MSIKNKKIETINEWLKMIEKSWTWELLTIDEQNTFKNYLFCDDYIPYGNPKQVYLCLSNYYNFFIKGIELIDKSRFK